MTSRPKAINRRHRQQHIIRSHHRRQQRHATHTSRRPNHISNSKRTMILPSCVRYPLTRIPGIRRTIRIIINRHSVNNLSNSINSNGTRNSPSVNNNRHQNIISTITSRPSSMTIILRLTRHHRLILQRSLNTPLVGPRFINSGLNSLQIITNRRSSPTGPVNPRLHRRLNHLQARLITRTSRTSRHTIRHRRRQNLHLTTRLISPLQHLLKRPGFFNTRRQQATRRRNPAINPNPRTRTSRRLTLLI